MDTGECDKIHVHEANLCDISLDGDILRRLAEVHPPQVVVLPPPPHAGTGPHHDVPVEHQLRAPHYH